MKRNKSIYYVDGSCTVCLLLDEKGNKVLARGLSICSRAEEFIPERGREYARNRAMEALGRKRDCEEILVETPRATWSDALHMSLARDRFGAYKGYYKPELTTTEHMIIDSRKR